MAGDEAEMEAMMAQMQAANGGMPGMGSMGGMAGMGGRGNHKKRKSNLSLSGYSIQDLQSKQQTVDLNVEIEDYRAEKDLLMKAYDDIDLDDNGDIEQEEFEQGMKRLNVSLTDAEITQIFKLMDSDASNYVDRSEFTMFLTQRFESTELTRFQDAILRKLGGRTRKSISGAIQDGDEMDQVAISAMEREMRQQMNEMANEEIVILKEEEKLYAELEKQEDEQQDFGKIENAANWNRFEVAHWIDTEVKLNEYMTAFMKNHVDGSILLNDLGREFLMDIGVKRVHVDKVMRAIVGLRDKIRKEWDESECRDLISYPNPMLNDQRATDKIEELKGEISKRDEEIENLKKEYEGRIAQLLKTIEEREAVISQAEEQGFIFGDDGKDGDNDSNYSDSADIDDDDMPPLIDAHQQTVAYFGNGQAPNADMMSSQIQERHSIVQFEQDQSIANPTDDTVQNDDIQQQQQQQQDDDNTETQSPDNDNNDENKEKDDFEIVDNPDQETEDGVISSPPVDITQAPQTTVMKPAVPEERLLSHSPSPNLTPSASQMNLLQQQKSAGSVGSSPSSRGRGRNKHHRKNSTKTGFWNSVQGGPKKKPPCGTKAYWLYLDQKHEVNANFAHPKRVIQWHHHEIAWWLKSIKCEKYVKKFVEEKVSGEQLIYDMSTTVLSTDLGVKMLWCGKLMREIKALKIAAGLQYAVEDKINVATYRPSNEESITKQMEELQIKLNETEELHTEELKEKDEKFEELKQENDKLKTEIESLEQQVIELEKRKAKKSDDSDSEDEDEDDDYQYSSQIPNNTAQQPTITTITEETKEDLDGDNEAIIDAPIVDIPTEQIAVNTTGTTGKRPKGYFRKYPKEIRKLMRQIDDMERRSNDGEYGQNNRGKFGATNRAFKWNAYEVCHWLNERGFVSYIKQFNENGIDGEILVNDLNPTILHEDLGVKRFHTGKMLREIQVLRQGGLYTVCDDVIDVGYEAKFSASQEIEKLTQSNEEMIVKLEEKEKQIEELTSRPQIADDEKIVKAQQWDELNEEKARLAKQVDELEEKMDDLKTNAIPEQLKEEAKAQLLALTKELEEKKENDENFGNVINCRKWTNDEVCWFFVNMGLPDYVQGIRTANINGEIFLEDTSPDMLSSDIGVKRIHINQIMRQVQDLRHRAFGYEVCENVIDEAFIPEIYATEVIEGFEKKVEGLEDEIKKQEEKYNELNNQYEELGKEKETLITEKNGLLENIETLNKNIQDLKDQGQLEMEESAKAKIEELNNEIEVLNKTITDNKESYDEEKKEIEAENTRIIEEKDTNINELNNKIETLETDLNEANGKIEEFEEKERIAREEEEAKDNSYEAQLKRMAKNDPTFGVPKMAHKWSMEEVSHWLYTIKVPDYVESFKDKLVDGTILLSDLSPEQLRSELQIKQYHIGKISREIAKLKELAIPPLAQSDIICDTSYIPEKPAVEIMSELADQKDINAALNIELERVNNQLSTLKEIQNIGAGDIEVTKGGPNDPELKEELAESNENNNNNIDNSNNNNSSSMNNEEIEKLTKENKELNQMLEYLQKSKIDLAMQTATEMQKLRSMVRVASQAYEELTGTPLGQVAQWPSTQNFFYNTLGYSSTKNNGNNNNNNNGDHNNNRRNYR